MGSPIVAQGNKRRITDCGRRLFRSLELYSLSSRSFARYDRVPGGKGIEVSLAQQTTPCFLGPSVLLSRLRIRMENVWCLRPLREILHPH